MNWLRLTLLLLLAFLGVFAQATVETPRRWLGAQFDLLAPLVVCAALTTDVATVAVLAVAGGLWLDALSANPLGVSVLPLFCTGLALLHAQELLLRNRAYAQVVFGALGTTSVVVLKLGLLLTLGDPPLVGWGSIWQLLVVATAGGLLTPVAVRLVQGLTARLAFQPVSTSAFRPDREMKRGRH